MSFCYYVGTLTVVGHCAFYEGFIGIRRVSFNQMSMYGYRTCM